MTSVTVSEARATLPELLNRVAGGTEVTITRHGRPVAVVVAPDALRSRRAQATFDEASRIHDLLVEATQGPLSAAGLSAEYADELVEHIRSDRDRS